MNSGKIFFGTVSNRSRKSFDFYLKLNLKFSHCLRYGMKPETLGGLSFKPVFFFNEVYLNEWIN